MKIANDKLGMAVGVVIAAMALGASGSAQTGYKWEGNLGDDIHEQMDTSWDATEIDVPAGLAGPRGGHQGNLANDMVDTGAAGGPRVRDGGSFFVDLEDEEELVVTIKGSALDEDPIGVRPDRRARGPRVRLWGGEPGDAGGVVVSLDRPHRDRLSPMAGGLMSGTFDASGSFEVELPYTVGEAWVQGFSVGALGAGTKFTPVRRLGAQEEEEPTFDESPLSNAVRGALKAGDQGAKKSLHFFGAAKSGKLDGWVDVEVELSQPSKGSYHLSMDRDLAEATQLVELGGEGQVTVVLHSVDEVIEAVEDLAALQAFATDPHAKLSAKRSILSGSLQRPRCGTMSLLNKKGLSPMASPTRWAERTVSPEQAESAEVGGATRIDAGRGIRKNQPEAKSPNGLLFDGPVRDGGSFEATPEEAAGAELGDATRIDAGLGIRKNQPEANSPNGVLFDGPIHDGGSFEAAPQASTNEAGETLPASEPAKSVSKFTK